MHKFYRIWKRKGKKWVSQNDITSGGWNIRQKGTYKINICINGFWGEPKICEITNKDLEDHTAFGACYVAY